jgi:sodium-dependent dicarboxylate transporter 2/3/5
MLPVATPPNAVVYGTGKIPLRFMIRTGFWLDIAGIVAVSLVLWLRSL